MGPITTGHCNLNWVCRQGGIQQSLHIKILSHCLCKACQLFIYQTFAFSSPREVPNHYAQHPLLSLAEDGIYGEASASVVSYSVFLVSPMYTRYQTLWDFLLSICSRHTAPVHLCWIETWRQFWVKEKKRALLLCQAKGATARLKDCVPLGRD